MASGFRGDEESGATGAWRLTYLKFLKLFSLYRALSGRKKKKWFCDKTSELGRSTAFIFQPFHASCMSKSKSPIPSVSWKVQRPTFLSPFVHLEKTKYKFSQTRLLQAFSSLSRSLCTTRNREHSKSRSECKTIGVPPFILNFLSACS